MFSSLSTLLIGALLSTAALASPIELAERQTGSVCSKYTIIDTRGTAEAQGPSAGFLTMNSQIMAGLSGGTEYDTVYPASFDQDSAQATANIISTVKSGVAADPNACFFLEGYSQGAAATTNALPSLTGTLFTAVRGVYLIGNPLHKAGLTCNVDANGGTTTRNDNGIEEFSVAGKAANSIPSNWVSKTLDVCISGDGVCSTATGVGITAQHLSYGSNSAVQSQGSKFALAVLRGQAYTHS